MSTMPNGGVDKMNNLPAFDKTIDGFAEHAERMSEDPDIGNHAVPCPCQTCQILNKSKTVPEPEGPKYRATITP